ncbi:MAG: hypothetical protein GTN80_00015 [Nitrososphaeria archaeon]|nr:hypothetical protein [Nitrososphaeria archaeon]NIQ32032.1 hypothetical protein [Nitrososphaeria archaeon]
MKRRSKIEIYIHILDVAKHGLRSTHIANRANISYAQFQSCVNVLIEKELLKLDGNKLYETTSKGRSLLEHWNEILDILGEEEPIYVESSSFY